MAGPYISQLPSPGELLGAWDDPFNTAFFRVDGIVALFGLDARTLIRGVMGRLGASPLGFIPEFASELITLVKSEIIAPVREAIEGLITDAVDVALGIAGSIPVYGWIVKVADALLNIAIRLLGKPGNKFRPPFARFDKFVNDGRATVILNGCIGNVETITQKDWGVLFRPPAIEDWTRTDRSEPPGWSFQPSIDTAALESTTECMHGLDGLGWIPGTSRGLTQINVAFGQWCPAHGGPCEYGGTVFLQGSERQQGTYVTPEGNVWDTSTNLPSVSHLAAAVSSAVQTNTALPYNIDTMGIVGAWRDYMDKFTHAMESSRHAYSQGRRPRDDTSSVIRYSASTQVQAFGSTVYASDGTPVPTVEWVERWITQLQRRQESLLTSNVVAYCSEEQAAFKSGNGLGTKLRALRQEFLQSPWARRVDPADIPDAAFRSAVVDVQIKNLGLAARDVLGFPSPVRFRPPAEDAVPPVQFPSPQATAGEIVGAGSSVVPYLLAGGLGYLLLRRLFG